jgi:PAS domain-containing protein
MERWVLPDKSLVYISPSCVRITGYSREEHMSSHDLLMEIIHPDDRERFITRRNEAFEGNFSDSDEFLIIKKKGIFVGSAW